MYGAGTVALKWQVSVEVTRKGVIALTCNWTSKISVDHRYTGDSLQFHMVFFSTTCYYVLCVLTADLDRGNTEKAS